MGRGRTEQLLVTTAGARRPDHLIVEEPLSIRLDDRPVATTMRTPGHDYELAIGFCLAEGMLAPEWVRSVRYCAAGPASQSAWNVVDVDTGGRAPTPTARLGTTTSSCGLCGTASVEALLERLVPRPTPLAIDADVLAMVARHVRKHQELFEQTGAVHAAASFDSVTGDIGVVREDIGRHNAVDKVVGRLAMDGRVPAGDSGLFVSGRASFEMVQKAWAAGFGLVAAVSGPSALAVHTARAANLALVGFLRGDQMNVYHPVP